MAGDGVERRGFALRSLTLVRIDGGVFGPAGSLVVSSLGRKI
jgi:hypothetical protein